MLMTRYLTEEEKRIVRKNRQKEKELNHYQYEATQRMKPRPCGLKLKDTSRYD